MGRATLAAGVVLGLLCGALFLVAAARTLRRAHGAPHPLRAFAVFWLGGGLYVGVDAAWGLASLVGLDSLPLAIVALQVKVASACASFAALVVYLVAIYKGGRPGRSEPVIGGAYLVLFLALEAYYTWRAPVGDHVGFASLGLDYARPQPGVAWDALLALLFVPPIVASLAYASLLRVANDGPSRRRIALTSASLLLFFAPDLVGWLVGDWPAWDLVERVLALCAGLGILAATGAARAAGPRKALDPSLAARARELI
jgi:hypothetical protein